MKPYVPPPPGDPYFPAMKWHPETAESRVFDKAEDVPAGWLDTHPKNVVVKSAEPKPAEPVLSLSRKEIRAALDEGGIAYDKTAKTEVLHEALVTALKAHLDGLEIVYDPTADAKALLALVPKPE